MLGDMNQSITLLKRVNQKDSAGFGDVIFTDIKTVPAKVEFRTNNNKWIEISEFSTANVMFTFRYIPNITIDNCIRYRETVYYLERVLNVKNRNMWIEALGSSSTSK
jgi:head-tail adaptor